MIQQLEQGLAPLQGMPLWDAGRAATMLWLQLGPPVLAPTARDPDRITGTYAIHVQCAWRITGRAGIVTGSDDLHLPHDPAMPEWKFDAGRPGDALADAKLAAWIDAYRARPLGVVRITVDRAGGFALHLSEGFAFEVFPTAVGGVHDAREQWRLFKPGEDSSHFVVEDRGVVRDG